eukprot:scaffold4280_cov385-Prasinococcus_capsulatus_cf.AAC.9
MGPGEVLFQDNTANSPAAKTPQHYSGTEQGEVCQQLIVQVDYTPQDADDEQGLHLAVERSGCSDFSSGMVWPVYLQLWAA